MNELKSKGVMKVYYCQIRGIMKYKDKEYAFLRMILRIFGLR